MYRDEPPMTEAEVSSGGPVANTDEPSIRLDDLCVLADLDDRSDGVWTLIHAQIEDMGNDCGPIYTTRVIQRIADLSLWAAKYDVVACDDQELLKLTRVVAVAAPAVVYVQSLGGVATGPVIACVSPTTVGTLN